MQDQLKSLNNLPNKKMLEENHNLFLLKKIKTTCRMDKSQMISLNRNKVIRLQ